MISFSKFTMPLMLLALLAATGPALAQAEMSVADRVALIRSLSAQITAARKLPSPNVTPAMSRLVENAWLAEITNLEAYCLKKFGKMVWLAPFLPDDAANAERPAAGEAGVPAPQVKNYRTFVHRAEFVEDRLQKIALQQCK